MLETLIDEYEAAVGGDALGEWLDIVESAGGHVDEEQEFTRSQLPGSRLRNLLEADRFLGSEHRGFDKDDVVNTIGTALQ